MIDIKLESLELNVQYENNKKLLKKRLVEFKKFLKDEFSLIPEGYYTTICMSLGMCFGLAFGSSLGSIGISTGLVLGMFVGLIIGRFNDALSKKQNRVLRTILQ